MPLVSMKEMLLKAQKGHYAVGQFNINNLEWIEAILDEVEELQAPVILGVSEGACKYMGGPTTVVSMVKGYIIDHNITVPVAIHLDHGSSVDSCKKVIDAGYTSVMIDASHYPLEENIAITKEVVAYARAHSTKDHYISVEAELGRVGGQEDNVVAESMYAIPEECVEMVKSTDIDCLAPALGSVHGPYHGEPKLGFTQMEEIGRLVGIPLVLHGGSGIPREQIERAIACGTCKINVNTECQIEFAKILREVVANDSEVYDPRKILGPAKAGITKVVKEHCEWFGCIGHAKD